MIERKSTIFLIFLGAGILLISLMLLDSIVSQRLDMEVARERREMVRVLTLTDLCLFTEARYTRHPSMADLHTPFQDHPLSFEHFPSGAIMSLPPHITQPTHQ